MLSVTELKEQKGGTSVPPFVSKVISSQFIIRHILQSGDSIVSLDDITPEIDFPSEKGRIISQIKIVPYIPGWQIDRQA